MTEQELIAAAEAAEARVFAGRTLCEVPSGDGHSTVLMEPETARAFAALREQASRCGITLAACSAYRSFVRQYGIFKAKYTGLRPVLNAAEQPVDISSLSCKEKIEAIVYFSAVPGLSRHHLGTDLDIYAVNLLPAGQKLQLTAREYAPGSYFYPLGEFLLQYLPQYGFVRPFLNSSWQGGPEPWHISYAQAAAPLLSALTFEKVQSLYTACELTDDFVPELLSYASAHFAQLLAL